MRHLALVATAAALAALVSACGGSPPTAPTASVPATTASAATTAADSGRVTPTHVRIGALGVDSDLVPLGVDGSGALVPPESAAVVGWFAAGPAPGDDGPALLAGHVDSRTGPGMFYRLGELHVGDGIEVLRTDGSTATFTVSRVTQVAKADFPTQIVYGPSAGPELRLVTCGGSFDRTVQHYRDNIIVEAVSADRPGWTIG